MKILIIASTVPYEMMGGAEYNAILLAHGFSQHGHQVAYLATAAASNQESMDGDVHIYRISSWREIGSEKHGAAMSAILDSIAPDVVLVTDFYEFFWAIPACHSRKIPVVTVANGTMESSPFLTGESIREFMAYLIYGDMLLHLRAFTLLRYTNLHICISKKILARTNRWFSNLPTRVIYYGQPFPPPEQLHEGSSGQAIWVNNIKHWKRPEAFIDLARSIPEFRFIQIGRLPVGRYLRKFQAKLSAAPDNFTFLGPLPVEEVNRHLGQSDLYILTSSKTEGFSLSVIQSWLRRVPVVSLEFDPEGLIEGQRLGRVCQRDPQRLVKEVRELMRDENTRIEIGQRARDFALNQFSLERMVLEYESALESVLPGNGSTP